MDGSRELAMNPRRIAQVLSTKNSNTDRMDDARMQSYSAWRDRRYRWFGLLLGTVDIAAGA